LNRFKLFSIALGLSLAAAVLPADDLTGSESFLCTASQATICSAAGECTSEPPWNLNIPSFIQVDLGRKTLSTTEASGESRSTPIKNVEREDGLIFLQGVEKGRAFSFVIAEEDGMASVAVARDGLSVAVFGACTPMPAS
jgi:hypothetical protein